MKKFTYIIFTGIKNHLRSLLSLLIFMCGVPTELYSQNTFTLKDNDLNNSPNLNIGFTVFGADIYNPNMAFFVEGKLSYRFKKELGWIKTNYTYAFADRLEAVTEAYDYSDALPAEGTQPLRNIGGSIGFNFIKRENIELAKASFHFMNRSRDSKITIPIRKYRMYGLHAGFEKFRTIIAQGSTTSYSGTIVEGSLNGTTVESGNATPMMNMNIISVGIHRQIISHYKLEINNNGEITNYSEKSISTVFADFLIGTSIQLDDIMVPMNKNAPNTNQNPNSNSSYEPYNYYRVDINNGVKKIPIGGRIGWEKIMLKPLGGMVGAEFGFRPGIVDPLYNLYIMMKIGFMFNFKAK